MNDKSRASKSDNCKWKPKSVESECGQSNRRPMAKWFDFVVAAKRAMEMRIKMEAAKEEKRRRETLADSMILVFGLSFIAFLMVLSGAHIFAKNFQNIKDVHNTSKPLCAFKRE